MMADRKLPDGWRWVRFGDVVRQVKDQVDPETAGIDRYVAGEHMDTDDLRIRRWGVVGDGYLGPAFRMRFKPGHVLYGSRRTYLRKVAVADFEGICANTTFVVEPATDEVRPEFLPFVMTTAAFHEHSIAQSKGSVNPYINFRDIAWYEFPLPSTSEQRRIIGVLAASRNLVECYISIRTAALRASLAVATQEFGSEGIRPLEEVAEVELGKKRDPKLLKEGSPVRYLRAANVKSSGFELDDVLEMNFTESELKRFELVTGDVLVTEGCGSLGQIGACAAWDGELSGPVAFQMTLVRLRARDPANSRLLQHWADFAFRTGRFAKVASGTSVFHLSAARVRKMAFPRLEQRRVRNVVARLDAAAEVARLAAIAVEQGSSVLVGLRESLLTGGEA